MRVLVPQIVTRVGGVRRVLESGLPRLHAIPGVEIAYAELCRNDADMDELARGGVRVDRSIGVPGPSAFTAEPGRSRWAALLRNAPRLARITVRLARRLSEYDVCYVHGHRELLLTLAARTATARRRPPIVWHWHGPPVSTSAGPHGSWMGRQMARLGSATCARMIAVSPFSARQLAAMGADPRRIVTVLNAVSIAGPALGEPASGLPARTREQFVSLVACPTLRRHKGVHLAVDALRELPRNHVLWVTGDVKDPIAADYVEELESLAARTGVSDRVVFLGRRGDIHRVMAAADAVLVPSTCEESCSLVAVESQVMGIPVIGSTRGALPDVLEHGALGLLFDPAAPGSLASAIRRLAGDPDLRARVASSARHAAPRYSYDRWSQEVASVLAEAVGELGAPAHAT